MLIFTAASTLVIVLVGAALGTLVARNVRFHVVETYITSTLTQVGAVVTAHVSEDDFRAPFTGDKYDEFNGHVHEAMHGTNVQQVNLWSTDRVLLFSTDKEAVGGEAVKDKLWSSLLSRKETSFEMLVGAVTPAEPATDEHDTQGAGHAANGEHGDAGDDHAGSNSGSTPGTVRILYPVALGSDGSEISGVYEVMLSTAPLEHHLASVTQTLLIGGSTLVLLLVIVAQVALVLLRRRNDRLQELTRLLGHRADTDGLTGLHNHRHFQNYLESQTAIATRYNKELSLIILDLDFFKTVNDRFGHQVGDEVIKSVGVVFQEVLRDADYSARYGGEEFVVVMPETGAQGALLVAERLREATEALVVSVEGVSENPKITVSCGVADLPGCASDKDSLIAAADSALLFAKKDGRNRVCFFRDIAGADFKDGDLEKLVSRLHHASLPTIQALVAAVDSTDAYEHGQNRNLTLLASKFGVKLGISEQLQEALDVAAQVHDVGEAVVPERILGKTGALTESEVNAIRTHPEAGAKIVETASHMENLISAILHHHENWDGSGYPDKLAGEDIPFLARVLRVMDAYEAMISDRPYRTALSRERAVAELTDKAGIEFDPQLVELFIDCLQTDVDFSEHALGELGAAGTTTIDVEPATA